MNISSLLIKTSLIFYILAVVCFCAFCVVLLWYLISEKKGKNNVQTKSWTIESAKKFLESNNISIKETSNEKANEAKTVQNKTENSQNPNKVSTVKNMSETKKVATNQKSQTTATLNQNKTGEIKKPVQPKITPHENKNITQNTKVNTTSSSKKTPTKN